MPESVQIILEYIEKNAKAIQDGTARLNALEKQQKGNTSAAQQGTSAFGGLTQQLLGMINPTTLVLSGLGLLTKVVLDNTKAAAEAEAVNVRLNAALIATGRTSVLSAAQADTLATSLEHISAFDDESIKSAFQTLTQFGNIDTSSFEAIAKTAMDVTAAMGGDLASNTEAIGRILETGVVPRTWAFNAALKEQVKQAVEAGDSTQALALVLDELNKRYGGQATAQLNTYDGAWQKLKNDWQDLQELQGQANLGKGKGLAGWMDDQVLAAQEYQRALARAKEAGFDFSQTVNAQGQVFGPGGVQKAAVDYIESLDKMADRSYDAVEAIRSQTRATDDLAKAQDVANKKFDEARYYIGGANKAGDEYNALLKRTADTLVASGTVAHESGQKIEVAQKGAAHAIEKTGEAATQATQPLAKINNLFDEQTKIAGEDKTYLQLVIKHLAALNGMTSTAYFNLITTGGADRVTGGMFAGSAKTSAKPTATGGQIEPGKGYLVGDAPGGKLTPYTEFIDETGYVHPADETRAMVAAGMIDAQSMATGGDTGDADVIRQYKMLQNLTRNSNRQYRRAGGVFNVARGLTSGTGSADVSQAVSDAVSPVEAQVTGFSTQITKATEVQVQATQNQTADANTNANAQLAALETINASIQRLPTTEDMATIFKTSEQLKA